MSEQDYVVPHSIEAEKAVLGGVLIANDQIDLVEDLDGQEFYRAAHRRVWEAFLALRQRDAAIDLVTVAEQLGTEQLEAIGGKPYLAGLIDGVPRSTNVRHYAAVVREKATLRQLRNTGQGLAERSVEAGADAATLLSEAETELYALRLRRASDFVPIDTVLLEETVPQIDRLLAGQPALGLPTGFTDLDVATRGLHPAQFTLVAARPGMGKSALALQIAAHVSTRRAGAVAVSSLEMARGELALRLVVMTGCVNAERMYTGKLRMDERERVSDALKGLQGSPLLIDDGMDVTVPALRSKLRRLAMAPDGLSLVVVDYLQLMKTPAKSESRALAIGEVSRGLKALSKELSVPVVALSQLNRDVEKRTLARPKLSDLRESGSLEQDADNVWLLHREEEYERTDENQGLAELIIAKQRNGPTTTVKLKWDGAMTRFDNLEWRQ